MVPHSEFYWHERLPNLENTLQKAMLKYGIPEVFYVDNGQIYSSHQINTVCAELGICKISCRPYRPEGKGKVERFNETVRSDFLSELKHDQVENLHQLNSKYWAWLEMEYHQHIHSSTEQTPLNRWRQNIGKFLRNIEEKELQSIFLWRKDRQVNKVGLVSLEGLKLEVASLPEGKKVEIRYDPFDLSQVYIYHEGRFMQKARQASLPRWNTAKKQNDSQPNAGDSPLKTGIKHLSHLENLPQQSRIKQAKKLLEDAPKQPDCYQKGDEKESFTSAHFFKAVATTLKRELENFQANEIEEMQKTWDTYAPLEGPLVYIALLKATLGIRGILNSIAVQLKIEAGYFKYQLMEKLKQYIEKNASDYNKTTILIIDEAQLLTTKILEERRLFTNFNFDSQNPLNLILLGQPGLYRTIQLNSVKALNQRINFRYHLSGLQGSEARPYVAHHLTLAGKTDVIFKDDVVEEIFQQAGGIPRVINNLCYSCLLEIYRPNKNIVDMPSLEQVLLQENIR